MCEKTVENNHDVLDCVPNQYKTQQIDEKTMKKVQGQLNLFAIITMQSRCVKALLKGGYTSLNMLLMSIWLKRYMKGFF